MIAGMALATFTIRYGLLAASSRMSLPPTLLAALRYLPPVVLTAIVVPEVMLREGTLYLDYGNARLIGAIAALVTGLISRNLLLTIVVGMAVFFGWQTLRL